MAKALFGLPALPLLGKLTAVKALAVAAIGYAGYRVSQGQPLLPHGRPKVGPGTNSSLLTTPLSTQESLPASVGPDSTSQATPTSSPLLANFRSPFRRGR